MDDSEKAAADKAALDKSRWERYLYENHTRETLRSWARRLNYFRFCRDPGGAGGGGDSLEVKLRAETADDVLQLLRNLEIRLVPIGPDDETMQPGKTYIGEQYARLVEPITGLPAWRQPGWTHIRGVSVYVRAFSSKDWLHSNLVINVMDQAYPWSPSETQIQGAESLETLLAPVSAKIMDPPQDSHHCICPKYYPEFWQA